MSTNEKIIFTFFILVVSIIAYIFLSDLFSNKSVKNLAGTYEVFISGIGNNHNKEMYILNENGASQYEFYNYDIYTNKMKLEFSRSGIWDLKDNDLTISTEGKTGNIEEKFIFNNGYFTNERNKSRILKKTN